MSFSSRLHIASGPPSPSPMHSQSALQFASSGSAGNSSSSFNSVFTSDGPSLNILISHVHHQFPPTLLQKGDCAFFSIRRFDLSLDLRGGSSFAGSSIIPSGGGGQYSSGRFWVSSDSSSRGSVFLGSPKGSRMTALLVSSHPSSCARAPSPLTCTTSEILSRDGGLGSRTTGPMVSQVSPRQFHAGSEVEKFAPAGKTSWILMISLNVPGPVLNRSICQTVHQS